MNGIYNRFLANLMKKQVDLENDTIKIALMNNSHSFNENHNVWSDVSANEASGTGYTSGGKVLSGKSVTQGSPTIFDADNVTWNSVTISAYHAVIYDDTLANKDLIASIDFGGAVSVEDGTIGIEWDSQGIITLS